MTVAAPTPQALAAMPAAQAAAWSVAFALRAQNVALADAREAGVRLRPVDARPLTRPEARVYG